MFKMGDVIQRKPEHYNDWWRSCCEDRALPLDVELVFVRMSLTEDVVKYKWPDGEVYGCFAGKMQLASPFTLENE